MDSQDIIHALTFAILFVTAVIAFMSLPVWLLWQFHKANRPGAHWHLASKIWYCKRCWHHEYARKTRECPECTKRYAQGEHWIPVEELVRGQPSKALFYKAKQRVLLTESED